MVRTSPCPLFAAQCIFSCFVLATAVSFRAAKNADVGSVTAAAHAAGASLANDATSEDHFRPSLVRADVPHARSHRPISSDVKKVLNDMDQGDIGANHPDPPGEEDQATAGRLVDALFNRTADSNKTTAYISGVELNGEGDTAVLVLCFVTSTSAMLLFLTIFSIFRKCLVTVYSRPNSKESTEGVGYLDWIYMAFHVNSEQIVEAAGLDGWTLCEFHSLNMRMFFVLSIIIMPILCPLHWDGHNKKQQPDMLSRLDIGNMRTDGDTSRFWVHAILVWIVVIVTMAFLQRGHREFAQRRRTWLANMRHPRNCTLLVENIPPDFCTDSNLGAYFNEIFPGNVERTYICRQTDALRHAVRLLRESEFKLHVAEARYARSQRPADFEAMQAFEKGKFEAAARVDRERKKVEVAAEEGDPLSVSSSGFVTFKTRAVRRFATDQHYADDPSEYQVELAPDPTDVLYMDLTSSPASKSASELMGAMCLTALFIFWSPIVVFISGLTDLATLQKFVPMVKTWCERSPILDVLLGQLLTTLALKIFMWFLPGILFSIIRKFFSHKAGAYVQVTMERWYFYFLFIFVVLVTIVGRSLVITIIGLMEHPTQIFALLAASMPGTSHFYLGYLVLAWPFPAFPLIRFMVCLNYCMFRGWYKLSPELSKRYAEPEDEAYNGMGSRMGVAVLKTTIALSLCTCCPIICFITCIYFAVSRFVTGYLVVYLECKKPDIGGVMGMEALRQSIFGLVLYVCLMVGVLLKQAESIGPPLVALLALWPLYDGWAQFNARAWEFLSLEREIHAAQSTDAKTKGKYIQSECNADDGASPRPTTPRRLAAAGQSREPGALLAKRLADLKEPM